MSLQVWLPLTNGTLKQQGLKNISATIGGTVGLTDAGKLGKCATIGTAAGGITLPASAMTSFTECSVAFWINITSWNTDWDTIFQAGLGSTPWNNYIFGILRNQGNYLCFTVSNGSSTSSGSYASSNLTVGQWMHLAFTYGSSKCKIYINGVLDKEYSTSITPNFAGITHIAIGRSTNGSNYQCKCKLNDFRIYDHCLSPVEVKELAKGLVLHYPLNRQGWGQENLVTNSSSEWSSWVTPTVNGTNQCSNPGVAVLPDDKVSTDKFACQVEIEFSGVTIGTGGTCAFRAQGAVDNGWSNGTNPWTKVFFSGTVPSDGVYKYTWVGSLNDTSVTHTNFNCGFRADYWGSGKYRVRCIKVEKGSIITPWCPHGNQTLYTTMGLNGTTEYDCSGFCNNGEKTGIFTYTSDTPKYAVSTTLGNNTTKLHISGLSTTGFANSYSFAWWGKTSTFSNMMQWGFSDGIRLNGIYNGTLWNTGDGSNNPLYNPGTTTQVTAPTINVWHHYVMVGDGTTCKVYKDGVLWGQAKTYKAISGTSIYFNGWDSGTSYSHTNGYSMSDFRIYATALSADDVKSLYQNCATIDPDGTIRGQIRS